MAIQGAINTILGSTVTAVAGVGKILEGEKTEIEAVKDEEMRAKALKSAQMKINAVYKTNMSARARNAVVKDIIAGISGGGK